MHPNVSNQDWSALASQLGYTQHKIDVIASEFDSAFVLVTDWVMTSGNSRISIDLLVSALEHINRHDVADVILAEQGNFSIVNQIKV